MKSRVLQQLTWAFVWWQPPPDTTTEHQQSPQIVKWTSTAFSQYISSSVESYILTYIIDEWLSTVSDRLVILMPTKQVTAEKEHHITVQRKWFARVCPVRMNLKSSCYLQSTAAGITKPEAKRVNDSWSCESNDESADDANTTNGKSKLHDLLTGLE